MFYEKSKEHVNACHKRLEPTHIVYCIVFLPQGKIQSFPINESSPKIKVNICIYGKVMDYTT